jgi:uroporphyrinogen-III decarboxylase
MPAFYHKHAGVTYGEAFYFDPGHRAEVERAQDRVQHEFWGRHGVGSPDPRPSPNLFIQSIDLILRTQGAHWRFPYDACLESWGEPWANLTIAEIEAIDPRAAAHHPVVDAVLAQYRELERLYGDRADVFGLKSGAMTIHTPYTTAHQLRGQGLFIEMVTDPAAARLIFDKVWAIELAVHGRIAGVLGARPRYVHLGDCSASLLSARTYREVVLPANQRLAREFGAAGYHSCGPSTHLLAEFAAIPHLDSVQLGQGTDLRQAVARFPGLHLMPMVDSVVLRQESREAVGNLVRRVLEDLAPAPQVTLLAWALDRDTPPENVDAMYEAAGR